MGRAPLTACRPCLRPGLITKCRPVGSLPRRGSKEARASPRRSGIRHACHGPFRLDERGKAGFVAGHEQERPTDARSVAIAALRSADCREVRPDDHTAVLKLWSKRLPGPGAKLQNQVASPAAHLPGAVGWSPAASARRSPPRTQPPCWGTAEPSGAISSW